MGEEGKLIDEDAVERPALAFGLRLDPLDNVGRQPQYIRLVRPGSGGL